MGQFQKGDRVEFTHPTYGTISGTVERVNPKTVTLVDTSDGRRGWRAAPSMLRPVGTAPTPLPTTALLPGDTVEIAIPDPWSRTPTSVGVVMQVSQGGVEVYAVGRSLIDDGSRLRARPRRSFEEVLVEIRGVYSGLSPENLFADGERSRAQAKRLAAVYNRALRALFVEAGRRISEEEAFAEDYRRAGQS